MGEHAQLAHHHGKHAHAGLPAHQERLQAAFGAGEVAGKENVQHLKDAEFQRWGDDFFDILHGDLRALADVVGQFVYLAAQAGEVAPRGEGQVGDCLLRHALPDRLEARVGPAQQFRVRKRFKAHFRAALFQRLRQLFAPVRLAAHGKDHHAARGRVLQPIEHARGLALFIARLAAQERRPVAHLDDAAFAHERQRLRRLDDLRRRRALEHRLIELFQPRGQQRALQRPQRLALEVFLRPGKQIDALRGILLQLGVEFLPGHASSSGKRYVEMETSQLLWSWAVTAPHSSVRKTLASVPSRRSSRAWAGWP